MEPRVARRAVLSALIAGAVADVLLDRVAPGINVPIATVTSLALVTAFSPRRRPADPIDGWLAAVALLASLGPALRTDPTVIALDMLLVLGGLTGWSLAVAGMPVTRRATAQVVELGIGAMLAVATGAAILAARTGADGFFARRASFLGRAAPLVRGVLLAVPIVGVFTLLLTSADAVFGHGLDEILRQPFEVDDAIRRVVFSLAVAWLVGGSLALAGGAFQLSPSISAGLSPASSDGSHEAAPSTARRRGATEVLTVLIAVDMLFALFAVVQVVYLFGGADTLATIGMTYSDYARQGYFQLVAVVALAGLLVLAAHLVVGRTRGFLVAAGSLLVLTAVILASAAFRLRLYQEAYGWTELRFYVAASILWLAVGALVAGALLWRDRMRWLAHGLAMSAVAITLAVSLIGPRGFVAHENLARVVDPGLVAPGGYAGFDAWYVTTLGDDAIPELVAALDHLTSIDRRIVLGDLEHRRDELASDTTSADWRSWNLARERAREALLRLPAR